MLIALYIYFHTVFGLMIIIIQRMRILFPWFQELRIPWEQECQPPALVSQEDGNVEAHGEKSSDTYTLAHIYC